MAHVVGYECKLLYKAGGQSGGGAFTELTNVRDATTTVECDVADLTTRGNAGFDAVVPTIMRATIEFQMVWDTADTGFEAIKDAFFNRALIGFQSLDGTGGRGLQGDFYIVSFTRNESLTDAVTVDVSARIGYSSNPPQWL